MNGLNRLLSRSLGHMEHKTLQAHFSAVVAELEAKDTESLPASRREARGGAVASLRAYGERGLFPRNTCHTQRVPILRDERGVSCAMAHLLEISGRKGLVDSLARSNNYLYMEEAREPALLAWLEESGLSKEEACRIQAVYVGEGPIANVGSMVTPPLAHALQPLASLQVPAPDNTTLYLVTAILAATALWLGYLWLRRAPLLKEAAFAPHQPIIVMPDSPKRAQVLVGKGGLN